MAKATGGGDFAAPGIDPLTRLTDRATFVDRLAVRLATDAPTHMGLLRIELTRFSRINAALGPRVADDLLRKVADRLRITIPHAVDIARVSGDGFAVLLPASADIAQQAAQISEILRRPYMIAGSIVEVDVFIGSACACDGMFDGDDLLQAADIALTNAIAGPIWQVRYNYSMRTAITRSYAIERDLRAAVAQDQLALLAGEPSRFFTLRFQPKYDLNTSRLTGFEALLRWSLMDGTVVSPEEFIPVAEKSGLMPIIGIWLIRTACETLSLLPEPITIAINVSPAQLSQRGLLLSSIADSIAQHGISQGRLELEVTESDFGPGNEETVQELARMGIALWIDDFGTGHSSMSRLCSIPFTGMKIDKSITLGLTGPKRIKVERLLRSIISVADALGMPTVIEGIEDSETEAICREVGAVFGQGYLYAQPFTLGDALDFANAASL